MCVHHCLDRRLLQAARLTLTVGDTEQRSRVTVDARKVCSGRILPQDLCLLPLPRHLQAYGVHLFCRNNEFRQRDTSSLVISDQRDTSSSVISSLTTDLWAKIFSQLPKAASRTSSHENQLAQAKFLGLQLVCKRFQDVFRDHPQLFSTLYLSEGLQEQSIANLLVWLRERAAYVSCCIASCDSPALYAALGGVLCAPSTFAAIHLRRCTGPSLQLVSNFSTLTNCSLARPVTPLDITPLQALLDLQTLGLGHGQFSAAQLPSHLNNLYLQNCRVEIAQDCCCVTTLRVLHTQHCIVERLHSSGLMACCALQQLRCFQSCLHAKSYHDEVVNISKWAMSIPHDLQRLSCLSELCFQFAGLPTDEVDLACLYKLKNLHRLAVCCEEDLLVSSGLTTLQHLTFLHLEVSIPHTGPLAFHAQGREAPCLRLDVDWKGMQALQQLQITSERVLCQSELLGLCSIQALARVAFAKYSTFDSLSFESVARLLYQLGKQRPDIEVVVDASKVPSIIPQRLLYI